MTKSLDWFKKNQTLFSGTLHFDEPLAKHTYYRIGGPAAVFAVPKSVSDLEWLSHGIQETHIPFFILGQGSNVLVPDIGFSGLVIRVHRLNLEIRTLETSDQSSSLRIQTGASVAISTLLRKASQEGWAGLEFLTGIPGSVGGAVRMNAGTHLGETQSRLRKVIAYPLAYPLKDTHTPAHTAAPIGTPGNYSALTYEGNPLQFQYRKNLFLPSGSVVYEAEWEVEKGDPTQVKALIDQTLTRRKATQPIDFPSCGSVFKNPKSSGLSSWQVIEKLGLRGHRIGDAQFAEKHCNFIINLGNAKASDVSALIQLAKERSKQELGIELEEEVVFLTHSEIL